MTILEAGEYGIISSVDSDGQPYGVPVNYVKYKGRIAFHSAPEGHKIDTFLHNDRVSFCVVGRTELIPEKFSTRYESVIIFGRISEYQGVDKTQALHALIAKYSPEYLKEGSSCIKAAGETTRVFSMSMDKITGKASI